MLISDLRSPGFGKQHPCRRASTRPFQIQRVDLISFCLLGMAADHLPGGPGENSEAMQAFLGKLASCFSHGGEIMRCEESRSDHFRSLFACQEQAVMEVTMNTAS